jgi:hypothetical protein
MMSRIVIDILIYHRHKPIDLFVLDNTCNQFLFLLTVHCTLNAAVTFCCVCGKSVIQFAYTFYF